MVVMKATAEVGGRCLVIDSVVFSLSLDKRCGMVLETALRYFLLLSSGLVSVLTFRRRADNGGETALNVRLVMWRNRGRRRSDRPLVERQARVVTERRVSVLTARPCC